MQAPRGGSIEAQTPLTGLQLVPFRDVLSNVVQDAHTGLTQLAGRLPGLSDEERKRQLLEYLQTTRQRLQRLHVCAQWAHKAKAVNTCREVLKAAQDHGAAFVHTADELFRLHEELRFSRAPLFDVSTALHISQTGTYRLLPRIIEDELQQPGQRLERPGELDDAARQRRRREALRRVDFLLRSKLLATELPAGMRVQRVRGGQATVAAAGGQYTARLTLVPAPRDDVTLAKYRPAGEPEEAAAAKEEPEVVQPAADADGPSTSAAAAQQPGTAAAAAAPGALAGQQREGPDCWRWQLLSFELLPAAARHDPPPLLPAQRDWLQQHVEQRMWVAADVEQLERLGKESWVTVPELPSAKEQQQQHGRASVGGPSASAVATPSASVAAADKKGKQVVKAEPLERQQGPDQQPPRDAQQQLPAFAARPLAAMHGILCQTAGRLALFSLLLSDARQLEGGSWKGGLKLSRAAAGKGLRLAYWQGMPCTSHAELQCMREGRPYQPEAQTAAAPGAPADAAAQHQQAVTPAVEVVVQEDGSLTVESCPQLRHALSSQAVQLRLPLASAASLSADQLLLEAAAYSAALQLAAVQVALQRSGRLSTAHADLSIASSSSDSGSEAASPAAPQLHVWYGGSVQLSLSVQLRTGRLLLRAGPALLESDQGSDAAALVAAVQQQLDQTQRDALSMPLPPGSSRGMLAARLAADALGRLSMQLSMRQRMEAATAAAAACGLRPAALPQQLLSAFLRQAAALMEPPSANTLTLMLPAFPPPPDMQRWAGQQQQRRQGSAVGSGAIRCFLVLDFGEPAAAAGAAENAAPMAAVQQPGSPSTDVLPCMLLAVCGCTARGTVTRVLQLAELPAHVLTDARAAAADAAAVGTAPATSRKRRASDAAEAAQEQRVAAEAAQEQRVAAEAAGDEAGLGLALASAAAWCRRQASWEALRSQLMMLPVQHAEELLLGRPPRQIIRLPKAPVLAQLEGWAVAKLAVVAGEAPPAGPAPKPAATMQLAGAGEADSSGGGASGGAWRVDLSSAYFAHLPELLRQQGVRLAPSVADAAHIAQHSAGLTLRYSLAAGHSVLTAITDLVRLGMLHLCLTRMAGCMAANPLAGAAKAAKSNGGIKAEGAGVACDVPTNGGLANGQLAPEGAGSPASALAWPLPGCGSVLLQEAGLTHLSLLVSPPPLPDGLQHLEQPPPLRLTVSWDDTLASSSRGSSSGRGDGGSDGGDGPAAGLQRGSSNAEGAPSAPAVAAGSTTGGGGGASCSSGGGSLRHIRCRVVSKPALPEPVLAALAQQLEAGRVDLFLDSLCLAGHAGAAAARQLTPEAQRAAGLLPGALRLLGTTASAAAAAAPAGGAGSSALRLRAQLQQGGRATGLHLAFHAGGYALLQLAPMQHGSAAAAASIWLPPLWDRLAKGVPTFSPVEALPPAAQQPGEPPRPQQHAAQQLRQAWVHHSGLQEALAQVMRAVAATAAEAH